MSGGTHHLNQHTLVTGRVQSPYNDKALCLADINRSQEPR
jgi:hypothetical protein